MLLAVRGDSLLSDSDYILLHGERLYLIEERLYLIGEQEYLIGFGIQSIATTLHMQVLAFRSKHKNSSMKHTVTLHYPTINMVGF